MLCHEFWPDAKIVAIEPHPESFELLRRNTAHIPASQLVLIQAAVSKQSGTALLAAAVSHSRVGEYVADIWDELSPRDRDFGIKVPAIDTERLWETLVPHGIDEIDLLKLDCEGAEYTLLPELARLGHLAHIGWIRGEWHSRKDNDILSHALTTTHAHHIAPNHPHEVGLFIAHRR